VTSSSRTKVARDLVNPTLGANEPSLPQLVAHGVGERLDGIGAGNCIAIQVDQRMQFVETEALVSTKDGETRVAQRTPAERCGVVVEGRQRWLVIPWRPATMAPVDSRPESVAHITQFTKDLPALSADRVELIIHGCESSDQRAAVTFEILPSVSIEVGRVAHDELVATTRLVLA
jgi:hypothetical protein